MVTPLAPLAVACVATSLHTLVAPLSLDLNSPGKFVGLVLTGPPLVDDVATHSHLYFLSHEVNATIKNDADRIIMFFIICKEIRSSF